MSERHPEVQKKGKSTSKAAKDTFHADMCATLFGRGDLRLPEGNRGKKNACTKTKYYPGYNQVSE
jgi:hypothetical protein